MEEELEIISSLSEDEKESRFMGIQNRYIPPLGISLILGVVIYFSLAGEEPILALVFSILPLGLTYGTLMLLFLNKPPHYAADYFKQLAGINTLRSEMYDKGKPLHPFLELIEVEEVLQDESGDYISMESANE
ncbi:MAG: hypothetical protein HRT88_00240 [Lentisphaeraceae bacterium]|nr:hypothetical protein [Lentisphaeraceae bacterium]